MPAVGVGEVAVVTHEAGSSQSCGPLGALLSVGPAGGTVSGTDTLAARSLLLSGGGWQLTRQLKYSTKGSMGGDGGGNIEHGRSIQEGPLM